jgi:hypothetical protein
VSKAVKPKESKPPSQAFTYLQEEKPSGTISLLQYQKAAKPSFYTGMVRVSLLLPKQ